MTYSQEIASPPPSAALPPPPRILIWVAVVFLLVIVLAVAIGGLYLTNGQRLVALLPIVVIGGATLLVISLLLAFAMRGGLPRRFPLILTVLYLLLAIGGAFGAVAIYRSALPPRYQEEIGTMLPFMRAFLPATPMGGVLPTVAPNVGGLNPDDLLSLPLFDETPEATPALVEVTDTIETALPTTTPTLEPTATPTLPPTLAPSQTIAPTLTPVPATQAAVVLTVPPTLDPAQVMSAPALPFTRRASERMYGFTHVQQTWNNCGPANITMALSFYGWNRSQDVAASYLRPDAEDKNVSPTELVAFVNTQTELRAITRIGGDMELLKNFIAANFPVLVETSYFPQGYDWIGHYQTIVGYDDTARVFNIFDSYIGAGENGEGITEPYDEFDRNWQDFNRVFIVVYEPSREGLVQQILGERADLTRAAEIALATANRERRADPRDLFAWFNIGSSLVKLGRYEEAAAAYDRARQLGLPFRVNWYQFGAFEAYFETGRYADVLALVDVNLTNGAEYVEETYYWQGRVYEAQQRFTEASQSFQRALSHNPRYAAASDALNSMNS